MLTISSQDLAEWASRIEAPPLLPVLVRRLVHETCGDVGEADFPGLEATRLGGWDGVSTVGQGNAWAPAGRAGWEIGVEKSVKGKADGDYDKRTREVTAGEKATTAFVFVTPRVWRGHRATQGKRGWLRLRDPADGWREVRVVDGEDLVQWIETAPATEAWFREVLGKAMPGLSSINAVWERWSGATNPKLPALVFSEAIGAGAAAFAAWLADPPTHPFVVAADLASEAEALAATMLLDGRFSRAGADEAVVVSSPDALARVATHPPKVVVVTGREARVALGALASRCHVVAAATKAEALDDASLTLEPLSPDAFAAALGDAKIDDGRIARLARESGKSVTVLHRRLMPLDKRPAWSRNPPLAALLVPFALTGSWHDAPERGGDREALAGIAGKPAEELDRDFLKLASTADPPVYSIGEVRSVTSRLDALDAVRASVTVADLQRFLSAAGCILSEPDPTLAIEEGKRWTAGVRGIKRARSGRLRRHVAETLVLLAVHGRWLEPAVGFDPAGRVAGLVRDLLSQGETRWYDLRDVFKQLAEAAPEAFLGALERDLEAPAPTVGLIMQPMGKQSTAWNLRSDLLWALELLAWRPERFPRVARLLARLCRFPLNDNWTNKPARSLASLFRPWWPQTAAPVGRRAGALADLARREPDAAWPLLLCTFHDQSGFASPNARPSWRDEAAGAGDRTMGPDCYAAQRAALDLLLAWPGKSGAQLGDLIERLEAMPASDQERVWSEIEAWSGTAGEDDKAELRDRVRLRCPGWGQDGAADATQSRARAVLGRLAPADPVARHAWLFAKPWVEPSHEDRAEVVSDWKAYAERVEQARASAVEEIWGAKGLDGIAALATGAGAREVVGRGLAQVASARSAAEQVVRALMGGAGLGREAADAVLSGFLRGLPEAARQALLDRLVADANSPCGRLLARLYPDRSLPPLVERLPESERQEFWDCVPAHWITDDPELMEWFARGLAAAGRPGAAFSVVHLDLEHAASDLLVDLLRRVPLWREGIEHDGFGSAHDIVRAFEVLDARGHVPDEVLAGLEFPYLHAFAHTKRGPRALEAQVAKAPLLFVQLLAMLFKRSDDGQDPEEWRRPEGEEGRHVADLAYQLLKSLRAIPGQADDGSIDGVAFSRWVSEARALSREHGRAVIGDQKIGELLARSPVDPDGSWPAEPVRELFEAGGTEDIRKGFCIGVRNGRGVTTRGVYDGGGQERAEAARYRALEERLDARWPATAALLGRLAHSYEEDAGYRDREAELRKRDD